MPHTITTDGGPEFGSDFSQLVTGMGTRHLRSSAYQPTSNGMAEAAVKSVLHSLQAAVSTSPENWDECLWTVLMGLRNSEHSSTGFSPHFVMTGRHAVTMTERRRLAAQEAMAEVTATPSTQTAPNQVSNHQQAPPWQAVSRALLQAIQPRTTTEHPDALQVCLPDQTTTAVGNWLTSVNLSRISSPPSGRQVKTAKLAAAPAVQATTGVSHAVLPPTKGQGLKEPQQNNSTPKLHSKPNPQAAAAEVIVLSSGSEEPEMLDAATKAMIHQRASAASQVTIKIEENAIAAQSKQLRDFARRHHTTDLTKVMPEQSYVLMRAPASTKLHKAKSVEGPYKLIKWLPGCARARLADKTGKMWEVAAARLCPFSPEATKNPANVD